MVIRRHAPYDPAGAEPALLTLSCDRITISSFAKLKAANQRGQHWADPLKAWGDVLVRQGHRQEARRCREQMS